jgi:hypothetical protein
MFDLLTLISIEYTFLPWHGCDKIPQKSEKNWSKGRKTPHGTLPGKISFSVTSDQIQRVPFFQN